MKTTKKLISLLLTLVLALSVSTITAFASQTPAWVADVTAKVTACSFELETEDGSMPFLNYLVFVGDSFTDVINSLDNKSYAQLSENEYVIAGERYSAINEIYKVTLDSNGDVTEVKADVTDTSMNPMSSDIFIRKHNPTLVPMVAPTMDEDGCMSYYECACGKYFKDSDATNEIEDIDAWKTTPGMGLIHKLGMEEPTTEEEEEETAPTKAPAKTTAKADDTKKSPQTGATAMGLGVAGLGVALLAVAKKKD